MIESKDPIEDSLFAIDMLNTKDVNMLRGMFGELLEANNHVLKREIRDEFHSVLKAEIAASERRMIGIMGDIETRLISRIDSGFDSMSELIDDGILPQIDGQDREILMIKTHLKLA